MRNEGIEKIIKAYMSDKETEYDDEIELVADTLDSHGWMHVNDNIDGMKICISKLECEYRMYNKICAQCHCDSNSQRPATVGDLIRKGGA